MRIRQAGATSGGGSYIRGLFSKPMGVKAAVTLLPRSLIIRFSASRRAALQARPCDSTPASSGETVLLCSGSHIRGNEEGFLIPPGHMPL